MFSSACVSLFEREYRMRLTEGMVQRLIEINVCHLEWWHLDDVKRIYGVELGGTLAPVFIVDRITLLDYEQIELVDASHFKYTHI